MLKESTGVLSRRDTAWLEVACRLASTSQENFKHGALVVLGGAIQSVGINKNVLDPEFHKDASLLSIHAEEAALRRAVRTKNAVLYVARVNNQNEQRMSRPCEKCMVLLRQFGIKRVVYTINCMEIL